MKEEMIIFSIQCNTCLKNLGMSNIKQRQSISCLQCSKRQMNTFFEPKINAQQEKTETPIDHQSAVRKSSSEEFVDRSENGSAPVETLKGCGKLLTDDNLKFYCGKDCGWCSDIHYCDECFKILDGVEE